ncbi:CD180 antigen [Engraulis encrasicolus]|uniref:CD180 antigen n=1 Tax=Engraulis encrasicolus TaxID=184585 RepID=UPI002FD4F80B
MTCETADSGKNECREIAGGYDCSWLNLALVPEAVPNATQTLDFSFNRLPQLYRETFTRLTQLLHLDLTRCSIDLLYEGAFSSQNKLRTLILTGNSLKFMSYEAFSGLDSLAELVMPQTSVADLEDLPISELQLRALDVSDGSLHDLEGLTALRLGKMETFNLARNHIASLRRADMKAFNGSSSSGSGGLMMEVSFASNDIISVEDGAFAGLRFRSLDFRGCFERAEADVLLRGLEGVTTETLNMGSFNDAAHRSITTQSVRSLCNMNVTHLNLSRQRWASLSNATFECLAGLRSLDMTEMHLSNLPDNINSMGNLTHLTLDRNEFGNMCDIRAHNFPSLTWLSIRGPFRRKKNLIFQDDCLQDLSHLQYLDLSDIGLEVKGRCCEGQLRGLGQLRMLNLSHSNAMSWGALPFSATPQLQQLDCTGLHITLDAAGSAPFQNLAQLKALNLSSTKTDITQPGFLEGLKSLVHLNLRGNPVPEGHVLDPETFKHVPELQNLTLAECKLTVIGSNLFHALTKLTFADLSANHMTKVSTSAFYSLTNIHLDYAHNGIQMVDVRSVKALGPSSSIDLSFNPLDCSCSNVQFIDWAKANVDKLEHNDETLCDGTQQHISEVTLHCSPIVGIIAFGVTLLIVVAVAAGVFVLIKWKRYDRYTQL